MHKKTIVIFGISSFVGSNLAMFLKDEFRVVGTYFKNKIKIPGILTVPCDVMKREAIQMVLYTFKPEVTIYAVGLSSIEDCANYNNYADALNTAGLFNVATFTERYKSKLCYLSSAYIFPGENRIYQESDTPLPNTTYGKTKAASEFYIQKSCLNYLILRCCQFYGRGINPRQVHWFEYLERKVFSNESIMLDDKIRVGFLDVFFLAQVLKACIRDNVTNRLFQLSSKNVMSYFEFGELYTQIFGNNKSLIKKSAWKFPLLASKVMDFSATDNFFYNIDVSNLENSLNLKLPTIEESLKATYKGLKSTGTKARPGKKKSEITFI